MGRLGVNLVYVFPKFGSRDRLAGNECGCGILVVVRQKYPAVWSGKHAFNRWRNTS